MENFLSFLIIPSLMRLIYRRNLHFSTLWYFYIPALLISKSPPRQFSVPLKLRFVSLLDHLLFQIVHHVPTPDLLDLGRLPSKSPILPVQFPHSSKLIGRFLLLLSRLRSFDICNIPYPRPIRLALLSIFQNRRLDLYCFLNHLLAFRIALSHLPILPHLRKKIITLFLDLLRLRRFRDVADLSSKSSQNP